MNWTRQKAIDLLALFGWKKRQLHQYTDKELYDIGVEEGAWKGGVKFEVQSTLIPEIEKQ